jgi:hypothetical protein
VHLVSTKLSPRGRIFFAILMNMDWRLAICIVIATLLLVIFVSPKIGKKTKRISSSAMAGFDEVFSPASYASRIELEEQGERVLAIPAPEDKKL